MIVFLFLLTLLFGCVEDDPCFDGSWRDSRVNPGVGAERWQHVEWR